MPPSDRCGFIPPGHRGYAPCTRDKGHEGPCAHPFDTSGEYTVNRDDFRVMLLCTFRYSLGRRTYMSMLASEWVKQHFDVLTTEDVKQIIGDIESASKWKGGLGMDMDAKHWFDLQKWLKSKIGQCQNCEAFVDDRAVCAWCGTTQEKA